MNPWHNKSVQARMSLIHSQQCQVLYRVTTKDHRLVDSNLDPIFITIMSKRFLLGPTIYLIAVAISFVSTQVSLVLFIATPLYFLVSARKDKS